jgi:hypothetical protein
MMAVHPAVRTPPGLPFTASATEGAMPKKKPKSNKKRTLADRASFNFGANRKPRSGTAGMRSRGSKGGGS